MDEVAILAKLTKIFRDVFDDQSLVLSSMTSAQDIPVWDSVIHITIVVEVEHQFNVRFQTAEMDKLKNVGDLVRLIRAATAQK
jgi:acyl carrier protein